MAEQMPAVGSGVLQKVLSWFLARGLKVRPHESKAMLFGGMYFFFILTAYYIIRPIRDEMGIAGGIDNLAWLFTGTLLVMLAVNPVFSAVVSRFAARSFIPYAYRFFMSNLIAFFLLWQYAPESWDVWTGRAFYIWTSVFNLFVVSVFWAFMVDVFRRGQTKRLFGPIGIGGTLGAILGSSITAYLVAQVGAAMLLLVSATLIEVGVQIVKRFPRFEREGDGVCSDCAVPLVAANAVGQEALCADCMKDIAPADRVVAAAALQGDNDKAIGGGIFAGISNILRSPYFLGICAYMVLFTIGSTFLYFDQAALVGEAFPDRDLRTAFLGKLDLTVNILTLTTQLFLTGRILKYLGVGLTLAILPAISVIGFSALAATPALGLFAVFYVMRRGMHYAVSRPTREILFTAVSREDRYKAKSFIDTFVYRLGDQAGAWSYTLLERQGWGISALSLLAVPLSAVWLVVGIWLGKRQSTAAGRASAAQPGVVTP